MGITNSRPSKKTPKKNYILQAENVCIPFVSNEWLNFTYYWYSNVQPLNGIVVKMFNISDRPNWITLINFNCCKFNCNSSRGYFSVLRHGKWLSLLFQSCCATLRCVHRIMDIISLKSVIIFVYISCLAQSIFPFCLFFFHHFYSLQIRWLFVYKSNTTSCTFRMDSDAWTSQQMGIIRWPNDTSASISLMHLLPHCLEPQN